MQDPLQSCSLVPLRLSTVQLVKSPSCAFYCHTSPLLLLLPFLVKIQSLNEGSRGGPKFIMAYLSAESRKEMTNGAHPNTHPGGPGTSTLPRYLHKKQQRQKGMRSSSPMGRVILINAPVDGELQILQSVLMFSCI